MKILDLAIYCAVGLAAQKVGKHRAVEQLSVALGSPGTHAALRGAALIDESIVRVSRCMRGAR